MTAAAAAVSRLFGGTEKARKLWGIPRRGPQPPLGRCGGDYEGGPRAKGSPFIAFLLSFAVLQKKVVPAGTKSPLPSER